ncbi:outer membrane autotransporter protein [Phyllobacterium myrsinacearum]|uniref:Outer membrane autotransporter protein n=2 Tax=Phyllobacterium myrsinacearum TaxID=28101 RepID=A0A839EXW6_9HYPH|nr:outer membrane autotransporter protein [Phyllobacterium myrsinacearum]
MVLTGTNTYTGGTAVINGTLQLGNGGTTGSIKGDINVNEDANLVFNRSDSGAGSLLLGGVITGDGAVIQSGTGTTTLTGRSVYTGGTLVENGTLQLGNDPNRDYGSTGVITGTVTVNSGGTLLLGSTNALGYGNDKVDTVNLNGGTLDSTANGDNGWGITYNLTGGTMKTSGSGQFAFGGGTTVNTLASDTTSEISGNVTLRRNNPGNVVNFNVANGSAAQDLLVSADISEAEGSQGIFKRGAGTMVLTGTNTYTGGTAVINGTLQLGNGGTTGSIKGDINVNEDANLVFNRSDSGAGSLLLGGVITGDGAVIQSGTGTTTLTGRSVYTGGTLVENGTLQLGNDPNRDYGLTGVITGTVTVNSGGTLLLGSTNALGTGANRVRTINLDGGTLDSTANGDNGWGITYNLTGGTMKTSGSGQFAFGGGTTVNTLASANTSEISGNVVLREDNPGNFANFNVTDGSAAQDLLVSANISEADGSQGIVKNGAGTMVLTGNNTYSGGTIINTGTLSVGADRNLGSGSLILNGGAFQVTGTDFSSTNRAVGVTTQGGIIDISDAANTLTLNQQLLNNGILRKIGAGTLVIGGGLASSTGNTEVEAGILRITGSMGGNVGVWTGTRLEGGGYISGSVAIHDGGVIAPGAMGSPLRIGGNLSLNAGSTTEIALGSASTTTSPGVSSTINVAGNLALDGTLNLLDGPGSGPSIGYYRLFTYGSLTNNGMELGAIPDVLTGKHVQLNSTLGKYIDLLVLDGTEQFWLQGNNTWDDSTPWVNKDGDGPAPFAEYTGIFRSTGETITINGAQTAKSLQFVTNGYKLVAGAGGALITQDAAAPLELRVLTDVSAEIDAPITGGGSGCGGIQKTGGGTVTLTGNNKHCGTTVSEGILSVSKDENLGTARGGVMLDGGFLRITGTSFTEATPVRDWTMTDKGGGIDITEANNSFIFRQSLGGAGSFTKAGAGKLIFTESNNYSGGTLINGGTLSLRDAATLGAITGNTTIQNGVLEMGGTSQTQNNVVVQNGLIDLSNNKRVGDHFTVNGNYTGGTGSQVSLDVDFHQGTSDSLIIGGVAMGKTHININDVSSAPEPLLGSTILLVDVKNQSSDFQLTASGLPTGGVVRYDLARQNSNDGYKYVIRSGVDGNAASGVVSGFIAAQNVVASSFFKPSSGLISAPVDPDKNQFGLAPWIRMNSGLSTIKTSGSITQPDGSMIRTPAEMDTSFTGYQVGMDSGFFNINGTGANVNFGLTGGQIFGKSDQKNYANTTDFESFFYGAYAAFTKGAFFADVQVRQEETDYTVNVDDPVFKIDGTKVKGKRFSVGGSTSYTLQKNDWSFIPATGFTYSRSDTDDLRIPQNVVLNQREGRVSFDNVESMIAFGGITVSKSFFFKDDRIKLSPFLTMTAYHDFAKDINAVLTIDQGGGTPVNLPVKTNRLGTYGEASLGVNFLSLTGKIAGSERLMIGSIRGDLQFGEDILGGSVTAQFRMQF